MPLRRLVPKLCEFPVTPTQLSTIVDKAEILYQQNGAARRFRLNYGARAPRMSC